MPRPPTDSPARRVLMQSIMWIILGATVGLAALVSYQRGSSGETRLVDPITYRGATVPLPKGWTITKTADELSPVLLTATEPKRDNNGDEDSGGRILRIVREPLASYRAPIEYALSRFHYRETDPKVIEGKNYMAIGGSPGELLYQNREVAPKSLQEAMSGEGRLVKTICAATVAPSGRGVAIELEGDGIVDPRDIDLVKRIAAALKLADEPSLIDSGEVKLPSGVSAPIPADFSAMKLDDPLVMPHILRGKNINGPMRSITLLPIVMLPKDGSATLLTMLSMTNGDFDDAQVRSESGGGWRIDVDAALRQFLPERSFRYFQKWPGRAGNLSRRGG